ncbi:MAG: PEP/pyruvate-binding domain-containing protein [Johnsonella sp.]|nr:PEP/pyruvate-binding domain-containing protein [Johnsonella sp.]
MAKEQLKELEEIIEEAKEGVLEKEKCGAKAWRLLCLKGSGFPVPDFIVLDSELYDLALRKKEGEIKKLLGELKKENAGQISGRIDEILADIELPEEIIWKAKHFLNPQKRYAVRSSGILEDKSKYSFAGLYESFLHIGSLEEMKRAVSDCYRSLFSAQVLSYVADHGLDYRKMKMAVIIQEMVDAQYSGVAFTVDPLRGEDSRMLIELLEGEGEDLVGGSKTPLRLGYDWKKGEIDKEKGREEIYPRILDQAALDMFLEIQKFFGHPCDIEFALKDQALYILQARPITKLTHQNIEEIWTTANFRDGGVAGEVCTALMASLYEYSFGAELKNFVIDSAILSPKECEAAVCRMFYARPYWNLSFVKKVMSRIIGYKERDFDSTYGIRMNYQGEGERTRITPLSLLRMLKIAAAQRRIVRERLGSAREIRRKLLGIYESYRDASKNFESLEKEELERLWVKLILEDYFLAETSYFRQVFINTVQQAIHKESLSKYLEEADYLSLMSRIQNISHLRPFYQLRRIGKRLREDEEVYRYWKEHSPEEISEEIEKRREAELLEEFIRKFGYHSEKELNPAYPCFAEDKLAVIKMFRESALTKEDAFSAKSVQRQKEGMHASLEILSGKVSDRKFKRLKKKIGYMRSLLWWREEFKDISTRFYYLIRICTLALARRYKDEGILASAEDIWMLEISDLIAYIRKEISREEILQRGKKNRDYYLSFRNEKIHEEIGRELIGEREEERGWKDKLRGIGCNAGRVRARARVIKELAQINTIKKGEILIAKYTDTGWAPKFALLSGLITEYGGVLCHAAIISREYGIPCIVAAEEVLERVRDQSLIMMDGESGEIQILEE